MVDIAFLVYEYDGEDRVTECLILDIDKAVKKALSFNNYENRIYIDIFELNGDKINSIDFLIEDNMTANNLEDIIREKTRGYNLDPEIDPEINNY